MGLRQIKGITVIPLEKSFGFVWNMTEDERREKPLYIIILYGKMRKHWQRMEPVFSYWMN